MTGIPTIGRPVAHLPLGAAWFDLPMPGQHDSSLIEAQVDARIGREPRLAGSRQQLVDMLAHFGQDAQARGAVAAALLWALDELDGVTVAMLHTSVAPRSPDVPVDEAIEDLRARLARRHVTDRTAPEVDVRQLSAGRALRLQVITDGEPATDRQRDRGGPNDERVSEDGHIGAVLLETVQYWLPLPDLPATLLVSFATPNLAAGERLVAGFDVIAERLTLG